MSRTTGRALAARTLRILAAAALGAACATASAQPTQATYRCTGKDGVKYYGSTIPSQCLGQPIEMLSPHGTVLRRIESSATTEAERAARAAEADKKREQDEAKREEERRNRALLATYMSEKDIEDARSRALAENAQMIKQIQGNIADIQKRQAGYDKEMQFYAESGKAPGKNAKGKSEAKAPKPPAKLTDDIHEAQIEMQTQQNLLATKQKEVTAINAKYDEDKKRFRELTRPAGK